MQHKLVHEIWLDPEPDGQMLPGLCLAGPMGDGLRSLLNNGALKVGEVRGTSTFDVMTNIGSDKAGARTRHGLSKTTSPYREEWITIQRSYLNRAQ